MGVTGSRSCSVTFSGDVSLSQSFSATPNSLSPGAEQPVNLAIGDNTFLIPPGATGVTIEMPVGNLVPVTLKGVTGDQGIPLGALGPASFGFDPSATQIVLKVLAVVNNVRLFWS